MGASLSCPFSESSDLETGLESVIVKSISFGDNEAKTETRSVSFNSRNSEPSIMRSLGSGKMMLEGSVSFERRNLETMVSIKAPSLDKEKSMIAKSISIEQNQADDDDHSPRSVITPEAISRLPLPDANHPKHEAALKLQKVYKSFRTRRKLADCAVLIEQSWWKLLDFAELKRSSISFFEIEKHESAISRWSRARTRAAKVGKGLSKSDTAQKLALQHWLEAIDPRHRYGHNLHFYYVQWLHCQSREPFFYWLDVGEGRDVNIEKCPRSKLQQQCIKYLGPMERKTYEVVVEDGKLFHKQSGELLDTTRESKDKWIFVLSTAKTLYVGKKKKGTFQHSSFLAGGAASAAGRLVVENGMLKAIWPHSGHYRPTEENFQDFLSFLRENSVDLTDVKMSPVDEEDEELVKQSSVCLRSQSSEEDLTGKVKGTEENSNEEKIESVEAQPAAAALETPKSWRSSSLRKNLTNLKIPNSDELFERLENGNVAAGRGCDDKSPLGGYETEEEEEEESAVEQDCMPPNRSLVEEEEETVVEQDYMPPNRSLVEEEEEKEEEHDIKAIPKELTLRRQLSCQWTTGAGPRISCVRNHPSKLQVRALEHVDLSPRSAGHCISEFSPRNSIELNPIKLSTPSNKGRVTLVPVSSSPVFEKGVLPHRSIYHSKFPFSPLSRSSH